MSEPRDQDLVRATCRPRQQVVLGYWRMVLEEPASVITAKLDQVTSALRTSAVPYLHIAGGDLDPAYRQWLGTHLPAASVEVWPRTGHFPHLADPQRFAARLAQTARWVSSADIAG